MTRINRSRKATIATVALALLAFGSAACSSSSSDAQTTTTPAATLNQDVEPLVIVVTNDDGYDAEGIDVMVRTLQKLPKVEIHVVAPADNQSGQGNATTEGNLLRRDAVTLGGYQAIAVQGHPADTIRAALDDLHLTPDLVVSGINKGQNVGPIADISGTIGAARAGAARGIPSIAASQALGSPLDYQVTADAVAAWITEHRASLKPSTTPLATITNINGPSCGSNGSPRGTVDVPLGTAKKYPLTAGSALLATADCKSTLKDPPDDVAAVNAGFVAVSEIPSTPAATS